MQTKDSNIKDRVFIANSTYYDIEGNIVRYNHVVGELNVDGPSLFHTEVFNDYKSARQYIREEYGI